MIGTEGKLISNELIEMFFNDDNRQNKEEKYKYNVKKKVFKILSSQKKGKPTSFNRINTNILKEVKRFHY